MPHSKSLSKRAQLTKRFVKPFRVDDGKGFTLKKCDTRTKGGIDKDDGLAVIAANVERLQELQEKLYAQDRWSLLVIFQGIDASGKDSAIKSVFEGVNPQGCDVTSFKQPSSNELDHDFLWRTTVNLPERGRIGIFNRSYYEECLVVRVHPQILAKQRLPVELVTDDIWRDRFESITDFEKHLSRNGTRVVKFFLNLSKDEQRERFLARLDEPDKHWKFDMNDLAEREHWDAYQSAYDDMIGATARESAPWIVVPADHKWFARVVIGCAIVDALDSLDLNMPEPTDAARAQLSKARKILEG